MHTFCTKESLHQAVLSYLNELLIFFNGLNSPRRGLGVGIQSKSLNMAFLIFWLKDCKVLMLLLQLVERLLEFLHNSCSDAVCRACWTKKPNHLWDTDSLCILFDSKKPSLELARVERWRSGFFLLTYVMFSTVKSWESIGTSCAHRRW